MSDVVALVADNLNIWTGAIERKSSAGRGGGRKISLYGLERLRALILDLAVRGKLVPQDARDEPASALLPRMAAERQKRIKSREINHSKAPTKLNGKQPFELPSGWVWLPLGQTGNIFTGNSINASVRAELEANDDGRPFIATKDIGYGLDPIDYENGLIVSVDDGRFNVARPNSVFICAEGGSAGRKIAISDREISFGNKLIANELWAEIEPRFALYTYLSGFFFEFFSNEMTGIIGGISRAKFLALPFPLPPLAEQKRIVAKVDELMALCDALERASEGAMAAHQALVENLLATLTTSTDAADLATDWARLEAHFDTLFTTDTSIYALNQAILSLAVQGKLVAQDPSDEPASELIKRITKAKTSGNYKTRAVSRSDKNPIPTPTPIGWERVQVGDVLSIRTGFAFKSSTYSADGTLVFRVTNFDREGIFDLSDSVYCPTDGIDEKLSGFLLEDRDILMVMVGGSIGKTTIVDNSILPALLNQNMWRIRSYGKELFSPFEYLLVKCLNSKIEGLTQSTHGHLAMGNFGKRTVIIPPLAEQKRIVAKVDELMALCEQLKSRLADAAETQRHLADVIPQKAAA